MNVKLPALRSVRLLAGCLLSLRIAASLSSAATVTVDAASVVGDVRIGRSGVNTSPNFWSSTSPGYYSDMIDAKVGVVRVAAYPVDSSNNYSLADLDERVMHILGAGGVPLFIQGINNIDHANSQAKDATFYAKLLKLDGTAGGTHATNMAYLVQRYLAPPYNLAWQFWEVGNEPDLNVNYQVEDSQEYIDIFQSIHDQLVASGVRANVVLCGPVTSWDYGFGGFRDALMRDFLSACKDQVDVVTRHIYAEIYPWESPVADTAYNLLNSTIETIHFDSAQSSSQGRGEKALLDEMATRGVSSAVGTGVTEMNLFKNVNEYRFTITQGLWFLQAGHYALYNPRNRLTTGFQFNTYNNGSGGGWLGYYDSGKNRSYPYWATYIHGNLTGDEILAQTSDDAHLLVTGTRDDRYVYVQVLNRNTSAITAGVVLSNAAVTAPTLFKLTSTDTPDSGVTTSHGTSFSYAFPAMSAQVFRFPRTDYVSGVVVDNDDSARVTRTGSWYSSAATPGFHGADYLHDNNGGKGARSVRYAPTLPSAGLYQVYAIWTAHANRAANIPVDIVRADGATATVTVDQTANGGAWNLLGTYNLDPATAAVTIRNDGTTGYVVADALRFVPVPQDLVIDNTDSAHVTLAGSWTASSANAGYYGTDYLHDNNSGKGTKAARFAGPVQSVGTYKIYANWVANTNRSTSVPVDIVQADGTTVTVNVNQRINNGLWYPLGTYTIDPATAAVTVRNDGTTGYVVADAVRFVTP
ncbi:MAG TPA: hypothetical protein VIO38_16160 [Rariglobus sp.]